MRMIVMKDDLDHLLDADETIELTVDNVTYTLDLCEKNATKLRTLLGPWLEAAHDRTKVKRTVETVKPKKPERHISSAGYAVASAKDRRMAIREWGKANGYSVGQGRLSRALIEAYEAAHAA